MSGMKFFTPRSWLKALIDAWWNGFIEAFAAIGEELDAMETYDIVEKIDAHTLESLSSAGVSIT
jgi:hypothetical protein